METSYEENNGKKRSVQQQAVRWEDKHQKSSFYYFQNKRLEKDATKKWKEHIMER